MNNIADILTKIQADYDAAASAEPEKWEPSREQLVAAADWLAGPGYRLDVAPKAAETLVRYVAAWNAGKVRRGLFLHGTVGTGKTLFVKTLCGHIHTAKYYVACFKACGGNTAGFVESLFGGYAPLGISGGRKWMVIDDLGTEPTCSLFGQREEVLEIVLAARYRHWQMYGADALTFVTSNRTPAELQARYGTRIIDRLRAMCIWVEFKGESARGDEVPK
jgi:hypothetical protein